MKRNNLGRAVCILLCLCLALCGLCSCEKDREYDDGEVIAAAKSLLSESIKLNTVYYGHGISYLSDRIGEGTYCEADPIHLSALGFDTIAELKEKTLTVFTDSYSEQIFKTKLEPITVDGQIIELSRYYQSYKDLEGTEPDCIMVNKNMKVIFDDRMTFDYGSIRVLGSEGEFVKLEVDVTVKNEDGDSKTLTLSVTLLEESDGWRIDNPVFANYS